MNSQGKSFEEASINYIQAANVAMRAITTKYGYDIKGTKTIKKIILITFVPNLKEKVLLAQN